MNTQPNDPVMERAALAAPGRARLRTAWRRRARYLAVVLGMVGVGALAPTPAQAQDKVSTPVITPATAPIPAEVTLSSATDGASIYYTLDDSDPTPENGSLYTDPVTVETAGNLRAAAFAAGMGPSDISTGSYWASQIVYVDPPDIPLHLDVRVPIDLNSNGPPDVWFTAFADNFMWLDGASVGLMHPMVDALPEGQMIANYSQWNNWEGYLVGPLVHDEGDWPPGSTGLVGVRFRGGGDSARYGWIRVRMPLDPEPGAVLDWAYEEIQNTPILAGDTGVPICRVDLNDDGVVNTQDFLLFLNAWSAGESVADWNDDGTVNTLDFLAYINDWVAGC